DILVTFIRVQVAGSMGGRQLRFRAISVKNYIFTIRVVWSSSKNAQPLTIVVQILAVRTRCDHEISDNCPKPDCAIRRNQSQENPCADGFFSRIQESSLVRASHCGGTTF